LNYVVSRLVAYGEANMELTPYDSAKLRFMLELVFLSVVQFAIYATLSVVIGKTTEFFIILAVLTTTRTFSGGLHLKSYIRCFIFTTTMFFALLFLLPDVNGAPFMLEGLLAATVLLNLVLAPVSRRAPAHSDKSNLFFKYFSTAILIVYAVFLLNFRDSHHTSLITWVLFMQSIQLVLGKMLISHENKQKEREQRQTA